MQPETPAHLWDAAQAADRTRRIISGLPLEAYLADSIVARAIALV